MYTDEHIRLIKGIIDKDYAMEKQNDNLNAVEILALQNTTQLMLEKIKNIESNMRQLELKFIKELANVYKELIEAWKK